MMTGSTPMTAWGREVWELAGGVTKGHKGPFKGDRYVHYHVCGDGFPDYSYVKIYQIAQFQYVGQLYLNNC